MASQLVTRYLLELLRNEQPVFYNAETRRLKTGYEPVGEGE